MILRPDVVRFGGVEWAGVERLVVERSAARTVRAWSDGGAHAVFVDVPEQAVRVRVVQAADRSLLVTPVPGEQGQLRAEVGGGGEEGRRLVRIEAVVESVSYEIGGRAATRVVTLVGVSSDGSDPVVVTDAS